MLFSQPLQQVTLLRRYKRFLADVKTADGEVLTVHCPNSGSMLGCAVPGIAACISDSANPTRKYRYTLEMVRPQACWVGVNTARTNGLVEEALRRGTISELSGFSDLKREVRTSARSRLDFELFFGSQRLFLEAKNCSLAENGRAMFPDAVTERGTKHLRELIALKKAGFRAVIFFCIQRRDAAFFTPAAEIDPVYAAALRQAMEEGVETLAYRAAVSPAEIRIEDPCPLRLE